MFVVGSAIFQAGDYGRAIAELESLARAHPPAPPP
jgi:cytochrome c-type biogenesis protein CcmH/NrfG